MFFKSVSGSADFDRIKELPKRVVEDPNVYVIPVTKALSNGNNGNGPRTLLPIQAWALHEISRVRGLLGPIGVGHGKTGLDILTPLVVPGCRVVCLLVPASLKEQIYRNYDEWAVNFKVPNLMGSTRKYNADLPSIYLLTYDQLSRESSAAYLSTLQPDLIIADEAHHLRHKSATRTRRLLRYFSEHPSTRFCAWSGTLTSNSIKDYAHLSALALRGGSPLPTHWAVVEEWAEALDATTRGPPRLAGVLEYFGDEPRVGFHDRLVQTAGVVTTKGDSVGTALYFVERPVEVPENVNAALKELRATWQRPDGEELVEATQVYRCGRELASGFYYKWEFPRGETTQAIEKWKQVRANWHKELREKLKQNKPYLDSPLLCARAALRAESDYVGDLPVWHSDYFREWSAIKGSVRPITVPVWLSDFLIKDVIKSENAIIWYEHATFGAKLREYGITTYGAGENGIADETGARTVGASILAHGTGKNLQAFSNNVFGNYPGKHSAWEQVIGRTHRQGQKADEVLVQVYRHTPVMKEAFRKARGYAEYVRDTWSTPEAVNRQLHLEARGLNHERKAGPQAVERR